MLCLVPCLAPLLSPRHTFFYHQDGSASRIVLAALLNVPLPWLAFVAFFFVAERPGVSRIVLWTTFLLLLPWVLLRSFAVLASWNLSFWISRLVLAVCLTALAGLFLLWRPLLFRVFDRVHTVAVVLLAFLSLSWLLTLAQLAYFGWETRGLNTARAAHVQSSVQAAAIPLQGSRARRPRVVWILLDELAYDQVFGRRLPGLRLNAFDRLAAQSTVFSQASAPGIYTEEVIPQVLNGHPATAVRFTLKGQLLYWSSAERWEPFRSSDSIFADAVQLGYRTGLAGWHNPYCRLFAPVLDSCFWTSRTDSVTPEFDGNAPLSTNIAGPARRLLAVVHNLPHERMLERADDARYASLHIDDVRALFAATDRLLADPSLNFLFLHLPIPHPGGIFDRRHSRFTTAGEASYSDNLALADQYLAHVRAALEQRGEWDGATVLVMGDHSWRTRLLWEESRGWTAEDQRSSHGGAFDPRPAFLLKLSGQHQETTILHPFSTLRTRALLKGILAGEIRTPDDLQAWVPLS